MKKSYFIFVLVLLLFPFKVFAGAGDVLNIINETGRSDWYSLVKRQLNKLPQYVGTMFNNDGGTVTIKQVSTCGVACFSYGGFAVSIDYGRAMFEGGGTEANIIHEFCHYMDYKAGGYSYKSNQSTAWQNIYSRQRSNFLRYYPGWNNGHNVDDPVEFFATSCGEYYDNSSVISNNIPELANYISSLVNELRTYDYGDPVTPGDDDPWGDPGDDDPWDNPVIWDDGDDCDNSLWGCAGDDDPDEPEVNVCWTGYDCPEDSDESSPGETIPGSDYEINNPGASGGEGCESLNVEISTVDAGGSAILYGSNHITQHFYRLEGYGRKNAYCMHAASSTPKKITSKCPFNLASNRDKGIAAMYTYAMRHGNNEVGMNDAVRVFVAELEKKDSDFTTFFPYWDGVPSGQVIQYLIDYGKKIRNGEVTGAVADFYCSGLVTVGINAQLISAGITELGACSSYEAVDLVDDTELEFNENVNNNNNTDDFFYRTIELSFNSGGKYDIEILNDNLKIYDNLEYAVILPNNFVGRHTDNEKITFVIKSRRNVIHDNPFSDLGIDFSYKKVYKQAYYQLFNLTCSGSGCAQDSNSESHIQELFIGDVLQDDTVYNYSYRTEVPKSCNPDNVIGNKHFNITGYIDNGCCASVDSSSLSGSDLEHYNLMCKDEDNSHFTNNCGDNSNCVNEDNQLVVDKGANTEPYSTSTIGQKSLENVMRSVVYKHANMDTFYRQDNVKEHLDTEFTHNTYCMMYTSEDLTINLPTTTQGKSGEVFTFMNYYDEECLQDLNASVNECFRQPNLDGRLYFNFYIAKERYESDMSYYEKVIDYYAESKDGLYANGAANRSQANSNKAAAQAQYNQCVDAKNAWDWDYDLQGGMTFTYQQEIDNSEAQNEPIVNTVTYEMSAVPSDGEPVKFWPNVSTDTSYETKNCNDNGCAGLAKKHLYYRPSQVAYQIMDNGRIVLEDEYQYSAPGIENGIEVGYVYTINLTTKQGEYETKFGLSDIGHRGTDANLNKVFNRIDSSEGSPLDQFSTCTFCNTYSTVTRECETCPTVENLILNIISNDKVLAADRQGISTNWTDDDVKGVAARYAIESAATSNIAIINSVDDRYLSLASKDEVQEIEDDRSFLADVYNDSTKESLEYEITLSPDIMTKIRNNTRHSEYTYEALQVCNDTHQFTTEMNEDTLYCYSCTEDAKECQGSFIDTYFSYKEGRNKYKYFKYDPNTGTGEFKVGKISTLPDIFANGRYPDPELKEAYIYNYKNWP